MLILNEIILRFKDTVIYYSVNGSKTQFYVLCQLIEIIFLTKKILISFLKTNEDFISIIEILIINSLIIN